MIQLIPDAVIHALLFIIPYDNLLRYCKICLDVNALLQDLFGSNALLQDLLKDAYETDVYSRCNGDVISSSLMIHGHPEVCWRLIHDQLGC